MHVNIHGFIVCNIQVFKKFKLPPNYWVLTKGQCLGMNEYAGNLRRQSMAWKPVYIPTLNHHQYDGDC